VAVVVGAVELDYCLFVRDGVGADYTLHGDCRGWWVEVAWPLWNKLAALRNIYEHDECRVELV
jgi:hypothetical protein